MVEQRQSIQPTGVLHLGNYLGALRNWVPGQHENQVFHGIVDLHALTTDVEPGVGRESAIDGCVLRAHAVAVEGLEQNSFEQERIRVAARLPVAEVTDEAADLRARDAAVAQVVVAIDVPFLHYGIKQLSPMAGEPLGMMNPADGIDVVFPP